jgi:hypothetical protein
VDEAEKRPHVSHNFSSLSISQQYFQQQHVVSFVLDDDDASDHDDDGHVGLDLYDADAAAALSPDCLWTNLD